MRVYDGKCALLDPFNGLAEILGHIRKDDGRVFKYWSDKRAINRDDITGHYSTALELS